jgi:putative DNA primase/helicase
LRVVPEGDALTIGGRGMAGALAVPAYGPAGELQSLQLIPPQGQKMNLPGCAMSGASFTVGKPDAVLYLAEGLGTAWAVWQATGCAAVVCFGWGNVGTVARQLHQKDEGARLVLVPDAGKESQAEQIARELGIAAAFMPEASPANFDAWDLKERDGGDALAALLEGARQFEQETGWAEPTPLPDALPAVAPFEAELLPDALRGWVMDIAERMQCPPDFPAVGAVVALSALIGARAVMAPKERDDWRVVPNLWGLVAGRPGVMKSPALSEALKPLHRLELAERERWQAEHAEWETECKLAELEARQNEKAAAAALKKDKARARELLQPGITPPEPTMRR